MNKVFNTLLGAAVLLAFPPVYMLLLRSGETILSPARWLWLGGAALALVLAALLSTVRHHADHHASE